MRLVLATFAAACVVVLVWARRRAQEQCLVRSIGTKAAPEPLTLGNLREREFPQLGSVVYADWMGAALFTQSQLEDHRETLSRLLIGNPHSAHPAGVRTAETVEKLRSRILRFFGVSTRTHTLIFTSGATAALKLVGEGFPWSPNSTFAFLLDNHTSVLGIREYALSHGAVLKPLAPHQLSAALDPPADTGGPHLIALPMQSNFSGTKYDLAILGVAAAVPASEHRFWTLLDAAAAVGSSPLDLSSTPADFTVLSFYKMFGYPTGLGCLIATHDAVQILNKSFYGGGTVNAVAATEPFREFRADPAHRWEDGTPHFLGLAALPAGFDIFDRLTMSAIAAHTAAVAHHLAAGLAALRHYNGAPVCTIFGSHGNSPNPQKQGPVVTCNFLRASGHVVGFAEVEQLAILNQIYIRTGCFCNIGACQLFLGLTAQEIQENCAAGHHCGDQLDLVNGKPTGAVRFSFGYASNLADAQRCLDFAQKYFVESHPPVPSAEPPTAPPTDSALHLEALFVYPIKGCSGFSPRAWSFDSRGLLFDRNWILLSADTRKPLALKKAPRMAYIAAEIDEGKLKIAANLPPDEQPIPPISFPLEHYPTERIQTQNLDAHLYESSVNDWFSTVLRQSVLLVRVSKEAERQGTSASCTVTGLSSAAESIKIAAVSIAQSPLTAPPLVNAFVNDSPFLVCSSTSLNALNSRLERPVPIQRFRPNIVVGGAAAYPFVEDHLGSFSIADIPFRGASGCQRCQTVGVDAEAAELKTEPLLTLSTFRRFQGGIYFGVHAVVDHHRGTLAVGAPLRIHSKRLLRPAT
eukprot:TRINITY_DN5095_c0_g1_i1.p1 TRINITY_DN5095_c0_g1~~TRINITY_DN5095_c0_g1_i1.p1  ORF type:complete len:805 (+),score=142.58 TRINITY_DN5095_c0_g1_i1:1-2415(+)